MSLSNGILKDSKGRTGYIAANSQFQFDAPPQTGAVYTSGWSVCANGTLAIGDDAIFYQCLSGTFYNLYEFNDAAQCSQVYIDVIGGGSSAVATESSDGQPAASTQASGLAGQQTDGQPTETPVSQISDGGYLKDNSSERTESNRRTGQIQATTGTAAPVTQISDGGSLKEFDREKRK
jgi:hypothetical protein